MDQDKVPQVWLVILAYFATYVLWGTTYFAVLVGLQTLPPFIMAAVRFLMAAIVLFLIVTAKGEKLFVAGAFKNMLLGIVILTGGQGLFVLVGAIYCIGHCSNSSIGASPLVRNAGCWQPESLFFQ